MKHTNNSALNVRASVAIVSVLMAHAIFGATNVSAGIYNWGDFHDLGADVMFLNVEEDNGYATSLFAPEPGSGGPQVVGNSLVLDPQNFLSQSSDSSDLTDSQLSTTLMVGMDNSIETVVINEFGDYTLGGLSGSVATAQVGASFFWQVLEINGLAISLPVQTAALQVTTGGGPNGGLYDRPGDDGIATPWQGSAVIDVAAYLTTNLIAGDATKVALTFDNVLLTAADDLSSAFIKKKGVGIDVFVDDPFNNIPEPTSALLLGIGLALIARTRNRVR